MKTIKTEKDLVNFLKSVARKSVVDASLNLFESDSYVAKFANELEKEMEILGEQEEEAEEAPAEEPEPEAEAEAEPAADPEAAAEPKKPKRNPAAEKALSLPDYEAGQEVTFEQILTAINLVRAGNSTKNKKTKQEISDYFGKLDNEEKGVMLIYLKELAKIITGAIGGEEAHDPSDATTYFDIVAKKDEKDQTAAQDRQKQAKSTGATADTPKPEQQQSQGGEDVTPPIRVNEKQDYSGLKIIRG